MTSFCSTSVLLIRGVLVDCAAAGPQERARKRERGGWSRQRNLETEMGVLSPALYSFNSTFSSLSAWGGRRRKIINGRDLLAGVESVLTVSTAGRGRWEAATERQIFG